MGNENGNSKINNNSNNDDIMIVIAMTSVQMTIGTAIAMKMEMAPELHIFEKLDSNYISGQ